ncbi:hypothetical protein HNP55_004146 [Paucibacter oligotrophus]|uniref:F5/8 type C domain-containing protein n=1 Tax=Roseateles oligotrophus TaxID=1769250 RepID=A0A840LAI7_9BURK|nr:basic secretory protein-like protein [Roseateles oligotrophus]MBB4845594.1 hypothetical protein [Roseateles oligotrophus]
MTSAGAQAQQATATPSPADLGLLQAHAPGCSAAQVKARLASVSGKRANALSLAQAQAQALSGLQCQASAAAPAASARGLLAQARPALAAAAVAAPADLSAPIAAQIQASGENLPNEGRVQLFDNNTSSKWLTFQPTGWVSYNLGAGKKAKLSSYSLISANDEPGRDPLDWQLQGSSDGQNWALLDSQRGQTFAGRLQRRVFAVANAPAYQYFRLNITRNNGAAELQLAEAELIGSLDAAGDSITPLALGVAQGGLADASGGSKQFRIDVPVGGAALNVTLSGGSGDADLYLRYGQPASTSSYDCKSEGQTNNEQCSVNLSQAGRYFVLLKGYSAYSGASLLATLAQSGANWSAVSSPNLSFVNDGSPGGNLFNQLVPDPTGYIRAIAQSVVKTLYKTPGEVPAFDTLELRIERWAQDPTGVAWKAGDPPRITVAVNAFHLERIAAAGGNVAEEVRGILFHEMTHAYQHSTGIDLPAIEGLADTVRYLNGYIPLSERHSGGSWTDSYKTTAFFFAWIQQQKGFGNFTYCANQLGKPGTTTPWSWDRLTQVCAGGSPVAPLWQEYQAWLIANGVR